MYMIVISLMVDLPEDNEDWSIAPEFKNGPITRASIILVYILVIFNVYRDQDHLINFKSGTNILGKAKTKYYLYNFSQVLFAVYVFSHETLDPSIYRQFPKPEQELERVAKGQRQAYYFSLNHLMIGFHSIVTQTNYIFAFLLYVVYSIAASAYLK